MAARRLKARLYIEGQEVPVVSAQVKAGANTPMQAAFQIVPTDAANKFYAKTLVHLFYLDDREESPAEEDKYKLLFAGELIRIRRVKRSAGARAVVLICRDFTTYWDDAKMYYRDGKAKDGGSSGSRALKSAAFAGAHIATSGGKGAGAAAASLYQILEGSPVMIPGVRGLMGGLLHLLESMTGIQKGDKKFRGVNDYFTAAELRLRLSQMVGVSPDDDSSARLFRSSQFKKWLKAALQENNRMVSMRTVTGILLERIYHQYSSIAAPHLTGSRDVWAVKTTRSKRRKKSDLLPPRYQKIAEDRIKILDSHLKRVEQLSAAEAAIAPDKAMVPVMVEEIPTTGSVANIGGEGGRTMGSIALREEAGHVGLAEPDAHRRLAVHQFARAVLADTERDAEAAAVKGELIVETSFAEDLVTGADYATVTKIRQDHWERVQRKTITAKKLYEDCLLGRRSKPKTTRTKKTLVERLIMMAFSPDPWYMSPPRSNVVFPNQYSTFTVDRDYRAEITRLELSTKAEHVSKRARARGEKAKRKVYYAPATKDVTGTLSKLSAEKGAKFIMDHEVCSGIIPASLSVPDIDGFKESDGQCKYAGLPYMQRTATYLLHKIRLSARTGQLHMPFSPQLVAGFPGVIIDRHRSDAVQEMHGIEPMQYLAQFDRLQHALDQTGGSTTVSLTHVRTQREQSDFLGKGDYNLIVSDGDEVVTDDLEGNATLSASADYQAGSLTGQTEGFVDTTLANGNKVRLYLRGGTPELGSPSAYKVIGMTNIPHTSLTERTLGDPVSTTDVVGRIARSIVPEKFETSKLVTSGLTAGETPDRLQEVAFSSRPAGIEDIVVVPKGSGGPRSKSRTDDVSALLGLSSQRIPGVGPSQTFGDQWNETVKIKVRRRRKKTKEIDIPTLPFEEVVRPAWASKIYSNRNIGAYYQEMFGCLAITDQQFASRGSDGKWSFNSARARDFQRNAPKIPANPCIPAEEQELNLAATRGDEIVQLVKDRATISQSVDAITKTYRAVKDTMQEDEYSALYTGRTIATMRQILGKGFAVLGKSESPEHKNGVDSAERAKLRLSAAQRTVEDLTSAAAAAAENLAFLRAQVPISAGTLEVDEAAEFLASGLAMKADMEKELSRARKAADAAVSSAKRQLEFKYDIVGEEGFHSRAYGPYADLALLEHGATREIDGSGSLRTVDPKIDPRARRHKVVADYVLGLAGARGLLG